MMSVNQEHDFAYRHNNHCYHGPEHTKYCYPPDPWGPPDNLA